MHTHTHTHTHTQRENVSTNCLYQYIIYSLMCSCLFICTLHCPTFSNSTYSTKSLTKHDIMEKMKNNMSFRVCISSIYFYRCLSFVYINIILFPKFGGAQVNVVALFDWVTFVKY